MAQVIYHGFLNQVASIVGEVWRETQRLDVPGSTLVTRTSPADWDSYVYLCTGPESTWWAREKVERLVLPREKQIAYVGNLMNSLAGSWNAYHNSKLWC